MLEERVDMVPSSCFLLLPAGFVVELLRKLYSAEERDRIDYVLINKLQEEESTEEVGGWRNGGAVEVRRCR